MGELAPLARAQLAQICLSDHALNYSQPTRRPHTRRNLDYVDDELVYAHVGFGSDAVDYVSAWDLQRAVHARRVSGAIPDSCLLLEHTPVYTAGKRTATSDRPFGDPGAPVIDVDRGGKITWHGPGQLTGYPVVKLREPLDVVAYVRGVWRQHRARGGPQRDLGARRRDPAGPQGWRDRRPGGPGCHHARVRAE